MLRHIRASIYSFPYIIAHMTEKGKWKNEIPSTINGKFFNSRRIYCPERKGKE